MEFTLYFNLFVLINNSFKFYLNWIEFELWIFELKYDAIVTNSTVVESQNNGEYKEIGNQSAGRHCNACLQIFW